MRELFVKVGRLRERTLGTLTLTILLVLIFQVELIALSQTEFSSVHSMLTSLSRIEKIVLAVAVGPFIHQGATHLVDNLGVLLLIGGYIEYQFGRRQFYEFFLIAGYFASLVTLSLGGGGAVGASGVTYGLGAWTMVHATARFVEMVTEPTLDQRVAHVIPAFFGLAKTMFIVELLLSGGLSGAGDATHLFGAIFGLVWGLYRLPVYYGLEWRSIISQSVLAK